MGLGEMPGACQGQDESVKLRLQPVEASVDVGAQPGESANEHTERNREQDTDERGIHGAALTLRIGRWPRVRQHRADWESGLRQRQDEPVELPLEPVDPRVRLAIIRAEIAEVGAEQVERSGEHAEQRGAQDANERGGNRRIHDPNLP